MQQRSSTSTSRVSGSGDEHRAITIAAEQQQAKRRRTGDYDTPEALPLYHQRSAVGIRRDISRSRSAEKWVHAIPVLVLLCLFVLWWFSFPVDVVIKDGRITAVQQIHTPLPNDTRIDLTILSVSAVAATSPIPSIPQNLSGNNETYLQPASSPT